MNLIDKAIAYIDPKAALSRERSRAMLNHAQKIGFRRVGAIVNENRKSSNQILDHPDSQLNHVDRIQIMREARWLAENSSVVKSLLRKYRIFAVGRLCYIPRSENAQFNIEAKAYVDRWMRNADYTGRHSFQTLAGLAVISMVRDGDCGAIVTEDDDTLNALLQICPIRLQFIEADRIGRLSNTNYREGLKENERDFAGVVVDLGGKPLRYRIYGRVEDRSSEANKAELWKPQAEVTAGNFLHIYDSYRLDAYRGFSFFDSAIADMKDAIELLSLEKIATKYLASVSGVVTNADGSIDQDVVLDTDHADYNADAETLKEVKPGAIKYMAEGEKFEPFDFDRPSTTFNGFMETLIQWTGLAVNLPFGFIYSKGVQGTQVRMDAAQADREFQQIQCTLEERLLDPIVQRVLATGITLGHLPKVGDFDQGEWRYPAKVSADAGYDAKALIDMNAAGLKSKRQINADDGEERDLVRANIVTEASELIEDAKKLVEQSGGELDLLNALFLLEKRSPNAPVAAAEPAASPDSPAPV